jgi:uncharacterized protein
MISAERNSTSQEMTRTEPEAAIRLLPGNGHWWFLGPGGVARLGASHITPQGTLTPSAEQRLRSQGLFRAGTTSTTYGLTVLTSTDCNLGCGYCFQNTGQDETGGNRPPRIRHSRLTSETITTILEFAGRQMRLSGLDKLTVLLFGGEPLLNPRGCVELLTRAADYGLVRANMISNLTLMTPRLARQLSDAGLREVQVTFDGDRETHDHIRVRRSRGGTFDTILANLAMASEAAPLRWTLRVNVSHRNHGGMDALIERLGAGTDPSRCAIYFALVGDIGIGYGNDLSHDRMLASDFSRWQRRALELGFNVARPSARVYCRTCGPGDGRYGAVVNADGTLSSCWDTAGKPGWEVGTVSAGYLPAGQIEGRWVSCDHEYRYSEDARARALFQDTVDAALLDHLRETRWI